MSDQPLPIGVSDGSRLHPETPAPPSPVFLTQSMNWADLLDEYIFFTPAFLYLSVPLKIDPFAAYMQETNRELVTYYVTADLPLFQGLMHPNQDMSYNFMLFALREQSWRLFRRWLETVAWNDPHRGIYRRIRFQDIQVRDHPAYQRASTSLVVPTIPVVSWGIVTNKGSFYFKPRLTDDKLERPVGHFDPTDVPPELIRFADALRKDSPDPYNAGEE